MRVIKLEYFSPICGVGGTANVGSFCKTPPHKTELRFESIAGLYEYVPNDAVLVPEGFSTMSWGCGEAGKATWIRSGSHVGQSLTDNDQRGSTSGELSELPAWEVGMQGC